MDECNHIGDPRISDRVGPESYVQISRMAKGKQTHNQESVFCITGVDVMEAHLANPFSDYFNVIIFKEKNYHNMFSPPRQMSPPDLFHCYHFCHLP